MRRHLPKLSLLLPLFLFFLLEKTTFCVEPHLQRTDIMFDEAKQLTTGDRQDDSLKLPDLSKFGCMGYWFQIMEFKTELTGATIDYENGKKIRLKFVFDKKHKVPKFKIVHEPKKETIKIITKDISDLLQKDPWVFIQLCLNEATFKPHMHHSKIELMTDTYTPLKMGSSHHATGYFASDGQSIEAHGKILSPFYTRGLLMDDLPDLKNFGLPTHAVVLDLMKTPLSNFNNLENTSVGDEGDRPSMVEASYASFNGTHYDLAYGEYSDFYPDVKLKQDSMAITPNKNAIITKGIRTAGIPANRPTFKMIVNVRVNIKEFYKKSQEREYETTIPPLYSWMTKDGTPLLQCWPDFKVKLGTDKTTWFYNIKEQRVNCEFKGSDLEGTVKFSFQTGANEKYFLNLVIWSNDGRNISIGQAGTKATNVKIPEGKAVFPRETDFHLFGNVVDAKLQEPTPYYYDYELINIYTGYAADKLVLATKRGYEDYAKFANDPIVSLGENGFDAVGCQDPLSASFWNGQSFACLKWLSLDSDRNMKLSNETDKHTALHFKDWECQKHKFLGPNGKCKKCLADCDVCDGPDTCQTCTVDFQLAKENKKCNKCAADEIYDMITKICWKRAKDSDK
jgi:hypothetical protein